MVLRWQHAVGATWIYPHLFVPEGDLVPDAWQMVAALISVHIGDGFRDVDAFSDPPLEFGILTY